MFSIGAIPVTIVEKDVHFNFGGKVDIGPGYHEHGWRCRNHKGWWRRDIDPNIDIDFSICSTWVAYADQNHNPTTDRVIKVPFFIRNLLYVYVVLSKDSYL